MLVLVGLSAMWMGVASGLLVLYSADHAERAEAVREGIKKCRQVSLKHGRFYRERRKSFEKDFFLGIGVVSKFIHGAHTLRFRTGWDGLKALNFRIKKIN